VIIICLPDAWKRPDSAYYFIAAEDQANSLRPGSRRYRRLKQAKAHTEVSPPLEW